MSQPVTFEMEGTCSDGQMIVVKGWPDLGCQDVPKLTQKVIKQTTIQQTQPTQSVKENGCNWSLWALLVLLLAFSIVVVSAFHISGKNRRYSDE